MFDKCLLARKHALPKRKQKIKFCYLLRALHMSLRDKGQQIQIFLIGLILVQANLCPCWAQLCEARRANIYKNVGQSRNKSKSNSFRWQEKSAHSYQNTQMSTPSVINHSLSTCRGDFVLFQSAGQHIYTVHHCSKAYTSHFTCMESSTLGRNLKAMFRL